MLDRWLTPPANVRQAFGLVNAEGGLGEGWRLRGCVVMRAGDPGVAMMEVVRRRRLACWEGVAAPAGAVVCLFVRPVADATG